MTFLSQLYPSSQNEGTLRGEMNRQQAKNAFPGQELVSSCPRVTFLSQLYPSSQNEGTLRGEMNRQQAKNAFPGQELVRAPSS